MEDKAKAGLQHIPTETPRCPSNSTRSSIIARGRRDAANAASNRHYRQGVTDYNERNFTDAAASFKLAAEQGHAEAQYLLSTMYDAGQGLQQDDAPKLPTGERRAAEQGHAYAQANLSFRYYAANDFAEAFAWCQRAAHSNLAWAQYIISASCTAKAKASSRATPKLPTRYRLAANQKFFPRLSRSWLTSTTPWPGSPTPSYAQAATWYLPRLPRTAMPRLSSNSATCTPSARA